MRCCATSPESSASSYHRGMGSNDKCLFCRIANGEITARKVYEDDDVFAFEDINPQAPTHVLIIPRKHIPSLDDLGEGDAAILGTTIARAADIARNLQLNADGYRLVVNTGEAAGQTGFHVPFPIIGGRDTGRAPGL